MTKNENGREPVLSRNRDQLAAGEIISGEIQVE
jgi:hypothetical protein